MAVFWAVCCMIFTAGNDLTFKFFARRKRSYGLFLAIIGVIWLITAFCFVREMPGDWRATILWGAISGVFSIVGNILLLSKVDNQGIPEKKSPYRLDEQIRQSILELEPRWMERETEFDVEMDEITYYGNEALMFHVFTNLIGNAIKFGPIGGTVRITLSHSDGRILFTVTDEGEGISPDAIAHIFDKFYQGDSSHKSEGNGLGLALVKQILSAVGGEVVAENIEGGGCSFTVTLPADR